MSLTAASQYQTAYPKAMLRSVRPLESGPHPSAADDTEAFMSVHARNCRTDGYAGGVYASLGSLHGNVSTGNVTVANLTAVGNFAGRRFSACLGNVLVCVCAVCASGVWRWQSGAMFLCLRQIKGAGCCSRLVPSGLSDTFRVDPSL